MKLPSWGRPYFVKKALKSWKGLPPNSKRLMVILIPTIIVATFLLILFKNQLALWAKRFQIGLSLKPSPTATLEPKTAASPTPTPKPTPYPLKQGKETYSISQTSGVRPRIELAEIDPHEPKVGTNQKIRVRVSDKDPIRGVTISLKSDNKTTTLPPTKLVEGTNLEGIWETSWNMNDTILFTYVFTIKAQGTFVQSSVNLPIRLINQE